MIAVFGATGFIGRALTRRLLQDGFEVLALSRTIGKDFGEDLPNTHNLRCHAVGLSDLDALRSVLAGADVVFHVVGGSSPGHAGVTLAQGISDHVIPHVDFFEMCCELDLKRLVFLSSGGTVYGRPQSVPINEEHPTNPLSPYGIGKLTQEKYLFMLKEVRGLNSVIVRLSNPFGPGQSFKLNQGLIPAILQRHNANAPVTVFGDGSAKRDYIFIDDAVDALIRLCRTPDADGQVINIGSGEGRSIMDIMTAIEATLGEKLKKEFVPARSTDVDVNVLDISRATRLLGWAPQSLFPEAIQLTVCHLWTALGRSS